MSVLFAGREPDRHVKGFGGATHAIFSPAGTPKAREDCIPFTFSLEGTNAVGQAKFVKGLTALRKKEAREVKQRAKVAA
jgi:hypothetical protein